MHDHFLKMFNPMILRSPEGADSGSGGNNHGADFTGDNANPSNQDGNQNNSGQQSDPLAGFWDQKDSGSGKTKGDQTGSQSSDGQQTQQGQQGPDALTQRLSAMNFGDGVMTQDAFDALGQEGGPDFKEHESVRSECHQEHYLDDCRIAPGFPRPDDGDISRYDSKLYGQRQS